LRESCHGPRALPIVAERSQGSVEHGESSICPFCQRSDRLDAENRPNHVQRGCSCTALTDDPVLARISHMRALDTLASRSPVRAGKWLQKAAAVSTEEAEAKR
jgi:hypothetical protein